MERSLGGYGFRVEMVCGGSEGVGRAAELKPDLILLDVLVSDGSDWSVLSQLKSNPVLRHVPVVLHSMIDERSVAMALGAIDYILKPADRAILGECIKRNLRAPRGPVALIIDEDVERRRLLGVFIEDQGWMAVEAANADLGLIRLAESLPTVIVLDLDAPKASDIEFLRQLGSTSEWKAIPVLALSDLIIDGAMREKLLESVDSLTEKGEAGLDASLQSLGELIQSVNVEPASQK